MTTLQEELRQALIEFRPWVTYRAEDGYPAIRQLDGEELADAILPIVERIVTKQVGLHELGKCVPVEDANRVLSEARVSIAALATKLQAVEECYQDGRSQGYVLDSTLRRALDAEAHS